MPLLDLHRHETLLPDQSPTRRDRGRPRPGDFIPERATWSFVSELAAVEKKVEALVATDPARAVTPFETFFAGA